MSLAFAIALAACSARDRTSAIWAASNASTRRENAPSAPNTSSPATSGATTIDMMPRSSTTRSVREACRNDASLAVVAGHHHGTVGDGTTEHADARREVDGPDPLARACALDPGIVRELEVAGGGIDEVDHRAVHFEESRGLLDRRREQPVDQARRRHRDRATARDGGPSRRPWRCRPWPWSWPWPVRTQPASIAWRADWTARATAWTRVDVGTGRSSAVRIRRTAEHGASPFGRGGYVIRPRGSVDERRR